MTQRVRKMLQLLREREYRKYRNESKIDLTKQLEGKNKYEISTVCMSVALEREMPILYEEDVFGFNRSQRYLPICRCKNPCRGNISPGYGMVIKKGFRSILSEIEEKLEKAEGEQKDFYSAVQKEIEAVLSLSRRYREKAKMVGNTKLRDALNVVPEYPATSLYEACLFQKILIFALRCASIGHITLGRFDQYMYEFYLADIARGKTKEELLEIVELFFISLNLDTDLYPGIQQGDNGQSMVLGGFDLEGNDMFNELSVICMDASLELNLIDPKINLRVGKNTPDERYEYGTKLTKQGMGFPQYCNDDVVVPGLIKLGYEPADAVDYSVAACWEYIIPGKGMDSHGYGTFNFPLIVGNSIREHLMEADSFEQLMEYVDVNMRAEVKRIVDYRYGARSGVSPFLSVLFEGSIEKGMDCAVGGAKYYNFGCHGAGISNASDALAAVKKVIYDEKSVEKAELLDALEKNFEGYTPLRNKLLACPKMGNNDDYVDDISIALMEIFSSEMNGQPNGIGGVWRAGTGSAMEYILSAKECPATADGRLAGDCYGSSFSPSPIAKVDGPLSVILSFTKYDMTKIINGGPLTMEIHDTVFRNQEGEKKVAALVKTVILLGGHQLQINAVNRDTLLDAQKHPEEYPNLIVRVWGWSGYFCELDLEYQNHIINRMEYVL